MKYKFRTLFVPPDIDSEEEKEDVRRRQARIEARLKALDARISVQTRRPYTGGVVNANLRSSKPN